MPYIGLHIHKTAGTSLLRYLEAYAPQRFYGAYALRNFRLLELPLWATENHTSRDIFWGHAIYESFFYESIAPVKLFTFLRDPVERIISWYNMLKRRKKLKRSAASLEAFVESHRNSICTMLISRFPSLVEQTDQPPSSQALSILSHMGFIGFQSHFNDQLPQLLEWMDVPVKQEAIGARYNISKSVAGIDPYQRQVIEAANQEDVKLYNYAFNLYSEKPLHADRNVVFKVLASNSGNDLNAIKAVQAKKAQRKFISSLCFSLGDAGVESYLRSLNASYSHCESLISSKIKRTCKV